MNHPAAEKLAYEMSEISEECWCAQWLIGTEYALWGMLRGERTIWGMDMVREADIERLRALSAECDGWNVWGEDDEGPRFVPMIEWLKMYDEYKARQTR